MRTLYMKLFLTSLFFSVVSTFAQAQCLDVSGACDVEIQSQLVCVSWVHEHVIVKPPSGPTQEKDVDVLCDGVLRSI